MHLADGLEVKVVTGLDDHSRFVVSAKVVLRATARPVCQALKEALARHGIPGQISDRTRALPQNPGHGAVGEICLRWSAGRRLLLAAELFRQHVITRATAGRVPILSK